MQPKIGLPKPALKNAVLITRGKENETEKVVRSSPIITL